jgi:branched-chain amino acid transport system ATP-binding protein
MLKIVNLTKSFGGVVAVNNLSLKISKGKIMGLIGPNGAGKTTLMNLISGLIKPDSGKIILKNKNLTDMEPHQIAQLGVSRTFQLTRVFNEMTVLENLIGIAYTKYKDLDFIIEKSMSLLKLLELTRLKDEPAINLSGGQQKLLEIGRACVTDPEILLMDEPFVGVHPKLKKIMIKFLKYLKEQKGVTILLISHDMKTVTELCDEVAAMNEGRLIARGSPKEIQKNKKVIEAYLGE